MNLINQTEAKKWLEKMDITEYNFVFIGNTEYEYQVDIFESMSLSNTPIKTLPFKMNVVHGNFKAINCALVTLENAPNEVMGNFLVNQNQLTSLKSVPRVIEGNFNFSNNLIKEFDDCPEKARKIKCNHNPLISLKSLKTTIKNSLEVDYQKLLFNELSSLNLDENLKLVLSVSETEFEFLRNLSNKKYQQNSDDLFIEDSFMNLKALSEKYQLESSIKNDNKNHSKIKI